MLKVKLKIRDDIFEFDTDDTIPIGELIELVHQWFEAINPALQVRADALAQRIKESTGTLKAAVDANTPHP